MGKKEIKISLGTMICIIIIIILMLTIFGLWYYYNYIANKMNINTWHEYNNSYYDNNQISKNEQQNIEEYVQLIYTDPGGYIYNDSEDLTEENDLQTQLLPKFDNVKNAPRDWIISVSTRMVADKPISYGDGMWASMADINNAIGYLFGDKTEKISDSDFEKCNIFKSEEDGRCCWNGCCRSISDVGHYLIKSIKKNDNIFTVEIVEYISHSWQEGDDSLQDSKGNIYLKFDKNENDDIIRKKMDIYVKENIDKLETKTLTIEYDKDNLQYHIISSK